MLLAPTGGSVMPLTPTGGSVVSLAPTGGSVLPLTPTESVVPLAPTGGSVKPLNHATEFQVQAVTSQAGSIQFIFDEILHKKSQNYQVPM